MKKNSKKVFLFGIFLLFACLSSNAQNWANFKRYADANILIDTPPKVVFMGDSITDAWVNFCPEFFLENNFAGRGISGQVTSQMLLRFQRDVVSLHPKKVVILAGIERGLKMFEYTPLQIKQALTGNGRAEKKQIQFPSASSGQDVAEHRPHGLKLGLGLGPLLAFAAVGEQPSVGV